MLRAFGLGILASLFFAFTFVLNKQMQVGGGHWIWSTVGFSLVLVAAFAYPLGNRKMMEIANDGIGTL